MFQLRQCSEQKSFILVCLDPLLDFPERLDTFTGFDGSWLRKEFTDYCHHQADMESEKVHSASSGSYGPPSNCPISIQFNRNEHGATQVIIYSLKFLMLLVNVDGVL
jgi:hypothetical protein